MTSCLSELKVTASFCFAFKIPDDPTATDIHTVFQKTVLEFTKSFIDTISVRQAIRNSPICPCPCPCGSFIFPFIIQEQLEQLCILIQFYPRAKADAKLYLKFVSNTYKVIEACILWQFGIWLGFFQTFDLLIELSLIDGPT